MFSVTEVLKPFSKWEIEDHRINFAKDRGVEIHNYCSIMAQGLYISTPPLYVIDFLTSFQKWLETITEVVLSEQRLFDYELGFHGKPDLVVKSKNDFLLIDIKTTPTISKTYDCQLSAYKHLVEKNLNIKITKSGALYLSKKGDIPKMVWVKDIDTKFSIFLQALNLYRYFKEG